MPSFSPTKSITILLVFFTLILWNASPISAQTFLNNHQQFMHSSDWESIVAKAIDNADDKSYAFAGNISPSYLKSVTRPILTKLGPNSPNSNPFDIQWAMTYITPGEPTNPSYLDFNVRDVLHTKKKEYVIAGQVRFLDDTGAGKPYQAFLLRTDPNGIPIIFKFYPQLSIFNSVIEHPNGNGFAVVGAAASQQAAILSVKYNLNPICVKEIIGTFDNDNLPKTSGSLNKVISYSDYFLSVGQATGSSETNKEETDTNVLYTTFDQQCNVITNLQYGNPSEYDSNDDLILNTEVGSSITFYKKLVFITGHVNSCKAFKKQCNFQDILYLVIRPDGTFLGSFHYDIQQKVDMGLAITFRKKTKTILIAGETFTREVLAPTANISKDIFLLEIKQSGGVAKLELFGAANTDEFHVDLTLSKNNHAVMLSNTPLNPICQDITGPWLIERYDNVQQQCRDASFDPKKTNYEVKKLPAKDNEIDVEKKKMELLGREVEMDQWTLCPKHSVKK